MATNGERTNIPLRGVEWEPPGYATAPLDERHWYWQQLAGFALEQKRDEIKRGIGANGRKLKKVSKATKAKGRWRSITGMGRPDGPPLDPADELSRTYKLLAAHVMVDGVTLYWRSSGRQSWQTILAYHRAGAGRLPVRNTIGISPAGRKKIKKQAWDAWAAREAVERPKREAAWMAKRKPPRVGKPPKGPVAKELPKFIKRPILIEAPEGQLVPTGRPPGPPPAPKPRPKPKPPAPPPPPAPAPAAPEPVHIKDRIAAYTGGDAKIAKISKLGGDIAAMQRKESEAHAKMVAYMKTLSEDEWIADTPEAKQYRKNVVALEDVWAGLLETRKKAEAAVADQVQRILQVDRADRATWNGGNAVMLEKQVRDRAVATAADLARLVKAPGQEIVWDWRNFQAGQTQRAHHNGDIDANGKHVSKVTIGGSTDNATVAHELGHVIEWQVPGVHERVLEFLAYRLGNEQPQSLATLFPTSGYRPDELGRKDDFDRYFGESSAYYVGMPKAHANSEVISMGIQAFFEDPVAFCRLDPEFAKFIMGMLDGALR